jgi:MFS family permease
MTTEAQIGVAIGRPNMWLVSSGLGFYVLLMYGIAYYGVTTAAPRIAAEFSVPVSTIFAMFTAALLSTAFLAPLYGRWMDEFGAARILLVGAILRAIALALMALSPNLFLFAIAFLVVQLLSQITEYDAAFACAVDIAGEQARTVMSGITLWGGVASTIFWPATSFLIVARLASHDARLCRLDADRLRYHCGVAWHNSAATKIGRAQRCRGVRRSNISSADVAI